MAKCGKMFEKFVKHIIYGNVRTHGQFWPLDKYIVKSLNFMSKLTTFYGRKEIEKKSAWLF